MKHLLLISFLSLTFSQELKVEGNLNVTGAVINDSLVQVIDSLKATNVAQQQQINAQQSLIEQLQAQIILLGQQLGLVDCNGDFGGDAVLDECGVCYGNNECFGVTDIDGNFYETILIGNQHWMAENLKVTHYRNGEPIPYIVDNESWSNSIIDGYSYFENNIIFQYNWGNLYNWNAVNDDRGICPEGWSVPEEIEFWILVNTLGGINSAANKLKQLGLENWNNNEEANNESGFTALGSGWRHPNDGLFMDENVQFFMWSRNSDTNSSSWRLAIYSSNVEIGTSDNPNGFSIRCIQD